MAKDSSDSDVPETPRRNKMGLITGAVIVGGFSLWGGVEWLYMNYAGDSAFSTRRPATAPQTPGSRDFSQFSLSQLLSLINTTEHKDNMHDAAQQAVQILEAENSEGAVLGYKNWVYILKPGQDYNEFKLEENLSTPVILKSDSGLAQHLLYEHLDQKYVEAIKQHVRWVVLTPNLLSTNGESAGLSFRDGTIFIDTQAEDGSFRDPLTFPHVAVHEGVHESQNSTLARLPAEAMAHFAEMESLEGKVNGENPSENLVGMYNTTVKRVITAKYLHDIGGGWDGDFKEFAPTEYLVAGQFLEAKISPEILRKYVTVDGGNEVDAEMRAATSVALVVHNNNNFRATRLLYDLIESENKHEKASAASALQFLYPELKGESTAGWQSTAERGMGFSFRGGSLGSGGYGISGLPELNDVIRGEPLLFGHAFAKPLYESRSAEDELDALANTSAGESMTYNEGREREVVERGNDFVREAREEIESRGGSINDRARQLDALVARQYGIYTNNTSRPPGFTYCGYNCDTRGGTIVIFQDHSVSFPFDAGRGVTDVYPTKWVEFEDGVLTGISVNAFHKYRPRVGRPVYLDGRTKVPINIQID